MKTNRQHFQASRAFSLVEILVCLGIMAVLAGMLIPALDRWRRSADNVACVNNLRQLYTYLNFYAADHNGAFPAASDLTTGYSWWLTMQNYINQPDQTVDIGKKTIFLCPAAFRSYPAGKARRTYGMNCEGIPDWRIPIRPLQSGRPTQTILLIDSSCPSLATSGDGSQYFRVTASPTLTVSADPRHDQKVNCLFLDGHVESFRGTDPLMSEYAKNLGK